MRPVTVELVFCRLIIKLTVFSNWFWNLIFTWVEVFQLFFFFIHIVLKIPLSWVGHLSIRISLYLSLLFLIPSLPLLSRLSILPSMCPYLVVSLGNMKKQTLSSFRIWFCPSYFLDTPNRFCRLFCSNRKMCQETLKLKKNENWKLQGSKKFNYSRVVK
jgi:hypothetical protein